MPQPEVAGPDNALDVSLQDQIDYSRQSQNVCRPGIKSCDKAMI
ncbi:hypothetical protein [Agrobacterium tumefaciens]